MTNETMGARIAHLRKQKNLTQDALADKMGVSPQAVSKWENDVSCPDIQLLPKLAKLLGVTTDVLLSGEPEPLAQVVPTEKRKSFEEMMLRIYIIDGEDGDHETVRISVPLMLVKVAVESGVQPCFSSNSKQSPGFFSVNGKSVDALSGVDFKQIMLMVESGVIGTLMEIDVDDGTKVRIVVE